MNVHVCLFSGYGGFHEALLQAGWKFDHVYFSEIDSFANALLKYKYPNGEHLGSVKNVSGYEIRKRHPGAKIIVTFGWPCQDNSIAGKRKGMAGTRSSLLIEAVRIIHECKAWSFIAENVEGLKSVNKGIDFVEAAKHLCNFHEDLPQYDIEMQLFNTLEYLPQNRRRLFFVGHYREGRSRKIFPLPETNGLYNSENRGGGKPRFVNTLDATYQKGWMDQGQRTHLIVNKELELKDKDHASTLTGGGHSGGNHSDMDLIVDLKAVERKGEIRGGGYCNPSTATHSQQVVESASFCQIEKNKLKITKYAMCLDANQFKGILANQQRTGICIIDLRTTLGNSKTRRGGQSMTKTSALDTACNQAVILQHSRSSKTGEVERYNENDHSGTINSASGGTGNTANLVKYNYRIRRLVPEECEKLQGLEPGWTEYGIFPAKKSELKKQPDKKEVIRKISDSQRYKLCGNGVSIPVVVVIAKQLLIESEK